MGEAEDEETVLLQTIKIPKNLLVLSDKLPNANYGKMVSKDKQALIPIKSTMTETKKTDAPSNSSLECIGSMTESLKEKRIEVKPVHTDLSLEIPHERKPQTIVINEKLMNAIKPKQYDVSAILADKKKKVPTHNSHIKKLYNLYIDPIRSVENKRNYIYNPSVKQKDSKYIRQKYNSNRVNIIPNRKLSPLKVKIY